MVFSLAQILCSLLFFTKKKLCFILEQDRDTRLCSPRVMEEFYRYRRIHTQRHTVHTQTHTQYTHTDTHRHTRLVGQCSRLSRIAQRSCAGKAIPVQRSCAASTFWRVQIGSTSQISIKTAPVLTLDVHVSMDSRIIIPRDPRRPQVTPEPRVPFSLMQMGSNHKSQREEWVPRTF